MNNDPLWMKIHHQYFYEKASLETIKEGIHNAIYEQKFDVSSIYNAVIGAASAHNRLDVLEFVFAQDNFKRDEKALTQHLSNSMMCRYFTSADFFIKKDVELNLNDQSVIWVLPHCSLELLNTIREKGYDVYDPQYHLLYLSFKEYPPKYDIIEDMLKSGAKFDDINSSDLSRYLVSYDCKEMIELIDYVISTGYDINKDDCRLVKYAIVNNCEKILVHLLSIGADTNPQEGSLFQFCARSRDKNLEMFDLLEKSGLALDINDDSIIQTAAEYDKLEVVQFLLEKGFKFEVAHKFGEGTVKDWCIEQMHNQLNQDLPTHESSKRKNKL